MDGGNPIIVALDFPTAERALGVAAATAHYVGGFKVGKELFIAEGPGIVRQLRALGLPVFLDLKLHDIPNTVARAVAAAARLDVQMLTLHCSGGRAMLEAAAASARRTAKELGRRPPLLLGVTVLTSLAGPALAEVGQDASPAEQVLRLARLAVACGLDGVVCSPRELETLRSALPPKIVYVTPGVRPRGAALGDQKRALTPREALAAGARWLVVGRPITAASDPAFAAQEIAASLGRREA